MAEDRAGAFRALHERDGIFVMPNPWDIGTARILESLGFEALATASAAVSACLGRADGVGEVSRSEALAHGQMLADAVDLPINGDLENGFGAGPEEVVQTIEGAIASGFAGCSIEDFTGDRSKPLFDHDLAVERIATAVAARDKSGPQFVLTARCEAFLNGIDDPLPFAIKRLQAMAAAGADVVYAPGIHQAEDIAVLVQEMPVPVNVLGGTGPQPLSVPALAELGVKRVSLGPRLFQAALGGFFRAGEELRAQGSFDFMAQAGNLGALGKRVRR